MVLLPEFRLLRTMLVVAEEGSLSRAGARLRLAQQSVSQQVRQLEGLVGAPLLERTSRGVTLTPVGEVLVREAATVLAQAERAMDNVLRTARGERGELRIGFLSSLANEFMPPIVRAFAERRPDIDVRADDLAIAAIVAGVRDGSLDAAITRPPLVDDLEAEVVGSEPVVIALPPGHRLSGAPGVRLSELAGEAWVMTPRASWPPWHRKYDEDFAAAGFRPNVVRRGTTPQGLLALVAAGVGITRLAASARSLRAGGVQFVPLEGERAAIVLLTRPGHSHPAIGALRQVALGIASGVVQRGH
jgi:DNA-binding transcriptional LysR family regulator